MAGIDARLVERLHQQAVAQRWDVSVDAFASALVRSAAKRFGAEPPGTHELESYFQSLHLSDLALACACAAGHDSAWEHFVLEYRPALYRAADAIDPSGSARELADSLYAELFGLRSTAGERQSVFRYFHGRSSLATWLRAVLTQRHVDAMRARARLEPLPDDHDVPASSTAGPGSNRPDRASARPAEEDAVDRTRFFAAMQRVLLAAIAALAPRDRLRLGCYYAQQMTLAEIGRLLREHEATVSRHLARTRRALREDVERRFREDERFGEREVEECFASVMQDPGTLDLTALVTGVGERKNPVVDRSTSEGVP